MVVYGERIREGEVNALLDIRNLYLWFWFNLLGIRVKVLLTVERSFQKN